MSNIPVIFQPHCRTGKGIQRPQDPNISTWYKDVVFDIHYVDFKFKKRVVIEVKFVSVQP